jgi:hypothetical protein
MCLAVVALVSSVGAGVAPNAAQVAWVLCMESLSAETKQPSWGWDARGSRWLLMGRHNQGVSCGGGYLMAEGGRITREIGPSMAIVFYKHVCLRRGTAAMIDH